MTSHTFDSWLGRREVSTDQITAAPLRRLAAVLDHCDPPWRKDELPPLGHWLYHLSHYRQSELGSDGHPTNVGILAHTSARHRMWAGSRVRFLHGIPIGAEAIRQTTVANIVNKSGARGEMLLTTIRHELTSGGRLAIEEEQDIAYLGEQARSFEPRSHAAMPEAHITRIVHATPELLFRFSALTFNAHRIHYDRDYARNSEHYPGLVVQGPLLATFLVDLFLRARPGLIVTGFQCRALAPTFDQDSFKLCSAATPDGGDLWVLGSNGELKMTAHIEGVSLTNH